MTGEKKLTRRGAVFIILACAVILAVIVLLCSEPEGSGLDSTEARVEYLAGLGWEVDAGSGTARTVTLPDAVSGRLPAQHPAYKAAWVLSVTLGAPMGDLYAHEEVNKSVINWAQSAFGTHAQMYLLMDEIGRPCAQPTADQQAAGDALAAGLSPGVSAQDGYLLVVF